MPKKKDVTVDAAVYAMRSNWENMETIRHKIGSVLFDALREHGESAKHEALVKIADLMGQDVPSYLRPRNE